jgi:hypothetical protein
MLNLYQNYETYFKMPLKLYGIAGYNEIMFGSLKEQPTNIKYKMH